jgi:hypothetical protein
MHGTEHREQEHRTLRFSTPQATVFLSRRIDASKRAAVFLLFGTGYSDRPFTRLQRSALSRFPFQGLRSRPDPSRPCRLLPLPVRPFGSTTGPVCPESTASTPRARYSFLNRHGMPLDPASTPLRDCYIPSDRSVQQDPLLASPPSVRARSPFASRRRLSLVSAADHRSRFATFPEARCSSNLLEPSSLCAGSPLASNTFGVAGRLFLKFFPAVFRASYSENDVEVLCIKRCASLLFYRRKVTGT